MKTAGIIKWYNAAKGFGFIQSEEVAGDIFVHYTAFGTDKFVKEGDPVSFDLITGPKGPQAFNVNLEK